MGRRGLSGRGGAEEGENGGGGGGAAGRGAGGGRAGARAHPPTEPKDLVKVPIITSTSEVGTPRRSVTPRPRGPTAPMEWASSR